MAHLPHLYLPAPWGETMLSLAPDQQHHLRRVLRMNDGDTVSYTDGDGTVGTGTLRAGTVLRADETRSARPVPRLTLAVATPKGPDRAREVVEKLAELGVDRLTWLAASRGEARPPRSVKTAAWAAAALQQSRGRHLIDVDGPCHPGALTGSLWVADPAGSAPPRRVTDDLVVLVGPEGGFTAEEVPPGARRVAFGDRVLRVGTAAVVAAVVALDRMGRLDSTGARD